MRRQAFTLLELLVVLAIISILVALTLPAVNRARVSGQRAQMQVELNQFFLGVSSFKQDYGHEMLVVGGGPNNTFRLCTSYVDINGNPITETINTSSGPVTRVWPEADFILRTFPQVKLDDTGLRSNGSPIPITNPDLLDPNQAAVFWLTGGTYCGFHGMSNDPRRPFTPPNNSPGEQRRRTYIDPPSTRIINPDGTSDGKYRDIWGTPLIIFVWQTSIKDYPAIASNGVMPYSNAKGKIAAGSCQIISAGADRQFGPGGAYDPDAPAWAYGQPGYDDTASFSTKQLGIFDNGK
jgi:prepilin-type N-terminal cleavage/methylation domain-containing protein